MHGADKVDNFPSGGVVILWGKFPGQIFLSRKYSRDISVVAVHDPTMLRQFPHPNSLVLEQSLGFQGQRTDPSPLEFPTYLLVDPAINPWGKPMACALGYRALYDHHSGCPVSTLPSEESWWLGKDRPPNRDSVHRVLKSTLTLSLPRVINFKFLLQPHQQYYITQYEEHGFS